MDATGHYEKLGYLFVRGLIPPEVARAFMAGIREDIGPGPIDLRGITRFGGQLARPAFQVDGNSYRPMSFFLWALTPTISRLIGRDLLPTYDYFRLYREGDICKVHGDRPSCEHSVSLTLDYSDGEPWELQVAHEPTGRGPPVTEDFGRSKYSSVAMSVGDAVLYKGIHHRHGRITPNPNEWSAHLFLHFVERGGPYADYAFDGKADLKPVTFSFE